MSSLMSAPKRLSNVGQKLSKHKIECKSIETFTASVKVSKTFQMRYCAYFVFPVDPA